MPCKPGAYYFTRASGGGDIGEQSDQHHQSIFGYCVPFGELPASPANNDIIVVKFVKAVTSLSWTGADTPSASAAGGYYTFAYDAASSSWY